MGKNLEINCNLWLESKHDGNGKVNINGSLHLATHLMYYFQFYFIKDVGKSKVLPVFFRISLQPYLFIIFTYAGQ